MRVGGWVVGSILVSIGVTIWGGCLLLLAEAKIDSIYMPFWYFHPLMCFQPAILATIYDFKPDSGSDLYPNFN
jgi:hypothetical protein